MNDFGIEMGIGSLETGYVVQACAYFTSDKMYSTAIDTYEKVEEYLTETYGVTRYTSRRGQSLPFVKGYDDLHAIVTHDMLSLQGTISKSVDSFSHRIIKIDDNRYLVIDHNIIVRVKSNEFYHCIIYSLIPQNIENL